MKSLMIAGMLLLVLGAVAHFSPGAASLPDSAAALHAVSVVPGGDENTATLMPVWLSAGMVAAGGLLVIVGAVLRPGAR